MTRRRSPRLRTAAWLHALKLWAVPLWALVACGGGGPAAGGPTGQGADSAAVAAEADGQEAADEVGTADPSDTTIGPELNGDLAGHGGDGDGGDGDGGGEDAGPTCPPPPAEALAGPPGAVAASTRNRLRWKRADILVNDLAAALDIPQPCEQAASLAARLASGLSFSMLGYSCDPPTGDELEADDRLAPWGVGEFAPRAAAALNLHRQALGGYEVFETLLPAAARPVATTTVATERVVMIACIKGVDRAAASTGALLGEDLTLSDPTGSLSDDQLSALVVTLYLRLLARDPLDAERAVIEGLAVDGAGAAVTIRDFAVLACHAVATTSEFLFY